MPYQRMPKTHCGPANSASMGARATVLAVGSASGTGSTSPTDRTRRRASRRAPTRAGRSTRRRRRRPCARSCSPPACVDARRPTAPSRPRACSGGATRARPIACRRGLTRGDRVEVVARSEHVDLAARRRRRRRARCAAPGCVRRRAAGAACRRGRCGPRGRTRAGRDAASRRGRRSGTAPSAVSGSRRAVKRRCAIDPAVGQVREVDGAAARHRRCTSRRRTRGSSSAR